ncbi:Putative cyclase [Micromonospora pallida]|uniref:Putative cyclase n=1 Tax=Micromonospora pallida TaxID=145854 RepID=A0A1C6RSL4_9ACTN|nr:cyclase family protein [Micromonospora pallida]SCL20148.1 Putative cyclase [Micromonospora pallida]
MHRLTADDIPAYEDLPVIERLGYPHAWDVFGADDHLGTLNYLTPDVVAAALSEASRGVVVALNLPIDQPAPPLFGREPTKHDFFTHDRNTWDDRLDAYFPQGSSQWDGFRHVRAREFGFFGGVTADPSQDKSWLGIDVWARRGIVGRGVLLDVAAYLLRSGDELRCDAERAITPELLREVASEQGVEVRHGDLLLVRTGWPRKYAQLTGERRTELAEAPAFPGLHAGEETARLLWNWRVSALITDVPAVEPVPGDPAVGSLHRRLLPLLGIPLGELFDLEGLSDRCQEYGRYTFLFTSAPVNLPGGCGSPANALAIF